VDPSRARYASWGFFVALTVGACGRSDRAADSSAVPPAAVGAAATTAATVKPPCPADGLWHECSLLERLDRSGLAPRKDSAAVTGSPLRQPGMLIHLGSAELEVFIYPDEASRVADEAKLPKGDFVEAGQPYTMRHERTIIRSANVIALLKSLRDRQRERVADAIMAGAPQPVR